MASTVEICNLALGWLGINLITSLDDVSVEAGLCKANYPLLRDAVLEARAWTFASKRITLAPTTGGLSTQEQFGYANRFTLPSNTIRVLQAGENPDFTDRIQWLKERDEILSNAGILYIRYVFREEDPQKFSSAFVQCLAARLAADLCVPLTENRGLQADLWKLYDSKLLDAAATDGLQGRQEPLRSDALLRPRYSGVGGFVAGPYVY